MAKIIQMKKHNVLIMLMKITYKREHVYSLRWNGTISNHFKFVLTKNMNNFSKAPVSWNDASVNSRVNYAEIITGVN